MGEMSRVKSTLPDGLAVGEAARAEVAAFANAMATAAKIGKMQRLMVVNLLSDAGSV